METKHTPGPWFHFAAQMHDHRAVAIGTAAQRDNARKSIDDNVVCLISPIEQVSNDDVANAKLIASAPDLLEALKNIVAINGVGYGMDSVQFVTDLQPLIAEAQEAIKKATE